MSANRPSYGDAIQVVLMLRMLKRRTSGEMPVNLIAERLEVHRRTVIRYVKALRAVIMNDHGDPLVDLQRREGETWVIMNRNAPPLASNVFQYAAIHAATSHLSAVGDPVLGDSARFVLGRLEDEFDQQILDRVKNGFVYVPFGPKNYDANEDVLDTITQAVLRTRPVDIVYQTPGKEPSERLIEPFTIVMYRDGLYVYARVNAEGTKEKMALFAIERIKDATLRRKETFEVPKTFNPKRHFGKRLGIWQATSRPDDVEIAFAPYAARAAKARRWPGFKGWKTLEDGREVLHLRIPVTPEVATWVRTWGPDAEVLSPLSLREKMLEDLKATMERYAVPPASTSEASDDEVLGEE